mgnify:CR=1 FL=1
MIIPIPRQTEQEYNSVSDNFYVKPGAPEIEGELKALQKEIVVYANYSVMPEFISKLTAYAKSFVCKKIGENDGDWVDCVDDLARTAAENFVKRYFRLENPTVGVSFGGMLEFKVREVMAEYWKNAALESKVSLNRTVSDDSKSDLENILSYKEYLKGDEEEILEMDDTDPTEALRESFLYKLEKVKNNLDKISEMEHKNYTVMFLIYLNYLLILQSTRLHKKLSITSETALNLLGIDNEKDISILETALLDLID